MKVYSVLFALFITFGVSPSMATITIGDSCDNLGTSTMSTDQKSIVACLKDDSENLIWKSMTSEAENGSPSGTIAFFALSGCPDGWTIANGNNGTIDMRGAFPRALDLGKGLDAGRTIASFQGDAIRNITGTFRLINTGSSTMTGPFYYISSYSQTDWDGGGTSKPNPLIGFDASRIVPTASENRPVNIALLACQKT